MTGNVQIAPSILSADFGNLRKDVIAIDKGGAGLVHIDIMDGHFVPNLTIGPVVVKGIRNATRLPFDVHLMITNPLEYIEPFAKAGADYITFHVECNDDLNACIEKTRELGKIPGVVLNPATPFEKATQYMDRIGMLLIMTVNPGFSGQKFMEDVIPKIKEARQYIDEKELDVLLEVDGGVTISNAGIVRGAGADIMVAGSAVYNKGAGVEENIKGIIKAANGAQ